MKKTILIFFLMILTYIIIGNVVAKNNLIPDDAIRIRVIANSNSDYDQNIKYKVKESLEKEMYNLLLNSNSIEEAREKIELNLDKIEQTVDKTLQTNNCTSPFDVNFGLNYFPKKEFKGVIYKEGYYESLVVTLGEGMGDNWWCVLFPPLCMLEAEDTKTTDVEYTTMVKALIDKYF